ncbi:hypothetical protein IWX49DRAFT_504312 [Phyllosticta citricarpa]|uniref:Uncharacterized protein n=1 Tax=Phyllosticta citricarpa TaxID=55181 RepID=A0ABR1MEA9_9PEZI
MPTASSQATICSLRHTSTTRDRPDSPTATSPLQTPSTRQQHDENLDHALQLPRPVAQLTPRSSPLYLPVLDHDFPLSCEKPPSKSLLDSCRPLVHRATACAAHLSSSPPKSLASFIPSRRVPEQSLDLAAASPSGRTAKSSLFADWFNGPSVSFQIGFASSSDEDSESDIGSDSDLDSDDLDTTIMDSGSSYTRAPAKARTSMASNRQSTVSVNSTHSAASKQNFFSSLFSRGPATQKVDPNQPQDLLSVMNIDEALFPNGHLDPNDPASYSTLLTSSKALLEQFQASYKALHFAMQDTRLEEDAMMEEKKEAEARAKHLQIQLDTFKFDLEKRDKEIHSLREQLEAERQMQRQDEARASRSTSNCKCEKRQSAASNLTGAESVISDRDSGFESESETIAVDDGAFSRPASMVSDADEIDLCPTPTATAGPTSAPPAAAPRPGHMKRKSTFDKNLVQKRQSKQGAPSPPMRANQPIVLSGGKIRVNDAASGQQQIDLWRENHVLRERVTELEKVVDETLGIVGGLEASYAC